MNDAATKGDVNNIRRSLLAGKSFLTEVQPKITNEQSRATITDVSGNIDGLIEKLSNDSTDIQSVYAFVKDAKDKLEKSQKSHV